MTAPARTGINAGARLLREMGVVRYRLRGARSSMLEPALTPVGPSSSNAPGTPRATVAEPMPAARARGVAQIRLRVHASDVSASGPEGPQALIWAQVLDWLRLPPGQCEWCPGPTAEAVALPASTEWLSPAGKRGLWQALRERAGGG